MGKSCICLVLSLKKTAKHPCLTALIEVWQCQADGRYDNVSDEYVYRGSQKVTANGNYHFLTTKPIPYPVEENSPLFRPGHIHLRISAIGEQDLITQIYFAGDPYLDGDPSTRSALSFNRILATRKINNNESKIRFDVVLKKEYLPDDAVFGKVSGIYKMSNNSMMEFYRDGDFLLYKMNSQIWGSLSYAGNNTFICGVNDTEARFKLLPQGKAKVQFQFIRRRKLELEGTKVLLYEK